MDKKENKYRDNFGNIFLEPNSFIVITRGEEQPKVPSYSHGFVYNDMDLGYSEPPEDDVRYDRFHEGKVYQVMSVAPNLAAIKCVAVSRYNDLFHIDKTISIRSDKILFMTVNKDYYKEMRTWNDLSLAEAKEARRISIQRSGLNQIHSSQDNTAQEEKF